MMLSFAAPPAVTLPVWDQNLHVPVRRVFCVGRNYAAHAREMGSDPTREPPFFFMKPADTLVTTGQIPYPPATEDLQHEVELVVTLQTGGADLSPPEAIAAIYGFAVGLDMTRRDLQAAAKKAGHPWDMAKGFDASAPIGPIVPQTQTGLLGSGSIRLSVNGTVKQQGDLADMIWPVADVICHLSRLVTLAPGDLIFTGTPDGVGPVRRGDVLDAEIEGLPPLHVKISATEQTPLAG
jgi:fumarylpyruvate hydrolase